MTLCLPEKDYDSEYSGNTDVLNLNSLKPVGPQISSANISSDIPNIYPLDLDSAGTKSIPSIPSSGRPGTSFILDENGRHVWQGGWTSVP